MVIRSIRQRDRANKTVLLARTERQSLSKSHMYKTSIKKLGPLARQIAGKPIEDAIVQMRFSNKKVARDVLKHLEHARDEAIVARGMGLGSENGDGVVGEDGRGLLVEDKKGKKRIVKNKTQIYIDQAWVGRGAYGRAPDYRARGQMYIMKPPHTSKYILLLSTYTSRHLPCAKCSWSTSLNDIRHNRPPQRRSDEDPPRQRARAKAPQEESLGTTT